LSTLNERERAVRQRLKDDLPHYAAKCLKIRTKDGAVEPFLFNRAQQHIHQELERQKAETGKVRALILKGRQQGCSTYVGARYYHQVTHGRGLRCFILTHEDAATQNLFEMVNRYHELCPELVRPTTGAANAKELNFALLDSGYKIGTAGTRGVGRSSTLQRFHGSEVAFWPNADSHAAGVLQAVPDAPGTEIILESTANGLGNFFHRRWQSAEAGDGDFQAIFVPWFWQEEYRREPGPDFVLDDEELEYAETYGLGPAQIAWRRQKIAEDLGGDAILFRQEYPANAAEAFQMSGHDSFILPAEVLRARKASCEPIGPLVLGVDPSRFGDDRFSIAWRRGRKISKVESKDKLDSVAGAAWIKQVIDVDKPARVFIDLGNTGAAIFDILKNWGAPYDKIVVGVNFGGTPMEPVQLLPDGSKKPGPKNRRTEMWMRSRDWLRDEGGADIPDLDSLQADACGPGYSYDLNQRIMLEMKEKMRARGVRSPDEWDAIALTFAEPVNEAKPRSAAPRHDLGAVGWMAA
jgi:hypothetical protein